MTKRRRVRQTPIERMRADASPNYTDIRAFCPRDGRLLGLAILFAWGDGRQDTYVHTLDAGRAMGLNADAVFTKISRSRIQQSCFGEVR